MSVAGSQSVTSSRMSAGGSKKNKIGKDDFFQVLMASEHTYSPWLSWVSIFIEVVQAVGFALNPHVWGHVISNSIIYFSHLPFWDGTYNSDMGFTGCVVVFWILAVMVLAGSLALLLGSSDPHFVSSVLMSQFKGKHIIALVTSVFFVPVMHMCLTFMVEAQSSATLWLFSGEDGSSTLVQVHFGFGIVVMIAGILLGYVTCSTAINENPFSPRATSYTLVDRIVLVYRATMCISFHLLLSRNMLSAYFVCVALASFFVAGAVSLVLPYRNRNVNTLLAVSYATAGWCALAGLIHTKLDSPRYLLGGDYFVVLACGWVVVAAMTAALSRWRYSGTTDRLLEAATKPEFVPREENPFAVAALKGDADLLPFPQYLPRSDYAFSPHRFVESDIVDETLRNEGYDEAASEVESTSGIEKYIDRVQVVSPTISTVYIPTDAELACRFLESWSITLDTRPTAHMLSFACRIYCKAMMKFPDSPIVVIHFVKFMCHYAPSLSRMHLANGIFDALPQKMYLNLADSFMKYKVSKEVRRVLGLRDKAHTSVYETARAHHKEALVQTAALWKMLEEQKTDIVTLANLSNSLTKITAHGLTSYVQAVNIASDDETLIRSFGSYLLTLMHNRDLSDMCIEEAESINASKRSSLLNSGGGEDAMNQSTRSGRSKRDGASSVISGASMTGGSSTLRVVAQQVKEHMTAFQQNLRSSVFTLSVIGVFLVLFALIAIQAGLTISISVQREGRVEQLHSIGRELSVSQQAVYVTRRVAEELRNGNDISTRLEELTAVTNELEALHSSLTHGSNRMSDKSAIQFLERPAEFLRRITTNTTLAENQPRIAVGFWDIMYIYIASLQQIIETASIASPGTNLLVDKNVMFVLENGPTAVSSATIEAVDALREADENSATTVRVSLGIALGVTLLIIASVSFVFLWNFRRTATFYVQALKLFRLVPKDTVKRLSSEAKENVERFVNGEVETKDQALDLSINPSNSPSNSTSLQADGLDEVRKDSAAVNEKLLHKFLHSRSNSVKVREDAPSPKAAIVSLLGSDIESSKLEESAVSNTSISVSSKEPSLAGDKRVSFMSTTEDIAGSQKGPGKRRHSISFGRALQEVQGRRQTVVSEFGDVMDSDSDDEGVTLSSFEMMEQVDNDTPKTAANEQPTGLNFSPLQIFCLVLILIFASCGSGLGINYYAIYPKFVDDRTEIRHHVNDFVTYSAQRYTDSLNIIMFSVSRLYEAYAEAKNSNIEALEDTVGKELDLTKFDYLRVFGDSEVIQRRNKIALSLSVASTDFPPATVLDVSTLQWSAPPLNADYYARYTEYLTNQTQTFAFTTSEEDRILDKNTLAEKGTATVLDQFYDADMQHVTQQMKRPKAFIEQEVVSLVNKQHSDSFAYLLSCLVLFVCGAVASLLFAISWDQGGAPRTISYLLSIVCVAAVVVSGIALGNQESDVEHVMVDALEGGEVGRNLYELVRQPTSYIFLGQTHNLHTFIELLNSEEDDRRSASVFRVLSDNTQVLSLYDAINDLKEMLMIATHLAADANGHLGEYPEAVQEDWNIKEDPGYTELQLKFPKEVEFMYHNKTHDNGLSPQEKLELAQSLMKSHRMLAAVQRANKEMRLVVEATANRVTTELKDVEDKGMPAATAILAVCAASLAVLLWLFGSLAVVSIEHLTTTTSEEEVYESMFATLTRKSIGTLLVIALLFIAVFVCGVVFSVETTQTQAVVTDASKRGWAVASSLSAAEEMISADLTAAYNAQQRLKKIVNQSVSIEKEAYFRNNAANAMRSAQNEKLFGKTTTYTVQDVRVTGLSTGAKCTNFANTDDGNLATVEAQYLQFFSLMDRMSAFRVEEIISEHEMIKNGTALPGISMTNIVTEARKHVDTLMKMLSVSDRDFVDSATSFHATRRAILVVVLVATLLVVVGAYMLTVRPIVAQLVQQEVGVKLLLNILPHEVRTSITEINDFFEGDNRGKDDLLKKKLLQSEKLLQNILPPLISRRLKNGEVCIADTHPDVSVVFAALIGFDEYSGKMLAQEIVIFLNDLIVTFDHVVDLLELEKIKTIGDVYFLCGGLTPKTKDNHALLCMECALIFREALTDHNERHQTPNLQLRIGVNSDPAVAGVIGSTKVAYDLWGDSVNTASRMQSTGLPGKIQASHNTYKVKAIQEHYSFSERKIEAKGKGTMTTHVFETRLKPSPFANLKWRVHR